MLNQESAQEQFEITIIKLSKADKFVEGKIGKVWRLEIGRGFVKYRSIFPLSPRFVIIFKTFSGCAPYKCCNRLLNQSGPENFGAALQSQPFR